MIARLGAAGPPMSPNSMPQISEFVANRAANVPANLALIRRRVLPGDYTLTDAFAG